MAEESRPALFMGALFGSFVGYILLVFTSFGGWYSYYYYAGYASWGYVGGWAAPLGIPLMAVLGLPLLMCGILSLRAVRSPASVTRSMANRAFFLALTQLIIVAVGATAFVALVSGNDSWWFDAGFYGSAIGSLLAVLCLGVVRGTYPPVAPGPAPYGWAPAPPAPYAPPQQPYAQPPQPYTPPPAPGYAPYGPQGGYAPAAPAPPPPPQPAPASSRFCAHCGAPMAPRTRFCGACGREVR